MYTKFLSTLINVILDPIFIYQLNIGVRGAAYATLISLSLVYIVIIYWVYIKQDTYLKPFKQYFEYNWNIVKNILRISLPASIEFFVFVSCKYNNESDIISSFN